MYASRIAYAVSPSPDGLVVAVDASSVGRESESSDSGGGGVRAPAIEISYAASRAVKCGAVLLLLVRRARSLRSCSRGAAL